MTGFCASPQFVRHLTGPYHPERPERIRAIFAAVREAGLIDSRDPLNTSADAAAFDLQLHLVGGEKLVELEPQPADEQWIRLIHPASYIEQVRRVCSAGTGTLDYQGDTPCGLESFDVAKLAVGAVLRCCDAVIGGEVRRAFAAVRPPGHHAEPDRGMGFCLFSNVAIAARYLQRRHGLERVAVVDFDVHHGNGTQAAFEDDPTVLFISLHEDPRVLYPGSGFADEVGEGAGRGYTLNLPMPPESEDDDYLQAMQSRVLPKLDDFRPQMLLVSAGFDAHREDPLAHINLSEEGFAQITHLLTQAADHHCAGKLVSALEGGYNLKALARSVVRHLRALRDA